MSSRQWGLSRFSRSIELYVSDGEGVSVSTELSHGNILSVVNLGNNSESVLTGKFVSLGAT